MITSHLTFLATTFKPEHTTISPNLTQCLEWAVKQTFFADCTDVSTFVSIHQLWTTCSQDTFHVHGSMHH
jgi:hypothetical protein